MNWFKAYERWDQQIRKRNIPTIFVIVAFLALAILSYLYAYVIEGRDDIVGFFLGLSTELTGIFLTFLAVNIIIQNAKDRDDLESMSMKFIHRIDYLVWVWLGGKRIFDLKELKSLLNSVKEDDVLYRYTQDIALELGNDAFEYKRTKKKYIKKDENFGLALTELSKLAKIRDTKTNSPVANVAKPLKNSLEYFTKIVEIHFENEVEDIYKNSSEEGQEWRSKGKIVDAEEMTL